MTDHSKVNYNYLPTPDGYQCSACGAIDCKLWCEYSTPSPRLLCADCRCREMDIDPNSVDALGRHIDFRDMQTNQLGDWIPAIPDEEGAGYWGYKSAPPEAWRWWTTLLTRRQGIVTRPSRQETLAEFLVLELLRDKPLSPKALEELGSRHLRAALQQLCAIDQVRINDDLKAQRTDLKERP